MVVMRKVAIILLITLMPLLVYNLPLSFATNASNGYRRDLIKDFNYFEESVIISKSNLMVNGRSSHWAFWTIMVYVDADNNLEPAGVSDINEMEMVGSTPLVNVLAFVDWWLYKDGGEVYYITHDEDPDVITSPIVREVPEPNMGDPGTLADFIQWTVKNYPAYHYMLILWDHGSAWEGICWDANGKIDEEGWPVYEDYLTADEVDYALEKSGVHFDIIGFDACLMGNLEMVYEIREHTQIVVGSEDVEPFEGWPYDRVLSLVADYPWVFPSKFAKWITEQYVEDYVDELGIKYVTMSAIRTCHMAIVKFTLDKFAQYLEAALQRYRPIVEECINSAEHYYYIKIYNYTTGELIGEDIYYYIDLYHFAQLIATNFKNRMPGLYIIAKTLIFTLKLSIIAEEHGPAPWIIELPEYDVIYYVMNHPNSHGLTIFVPTAEDWPLYQESYAQLELAQATHWDEFLQQLFIQ